MFIKWIISYLRSLCGISYVWNLEWKMPKAPRDSDLGSIWTRHWENRHPKQNVNLIKPSLLWTDCYVENMLKVSAKRAGRRSRRAGSAIKIICCFFRGPELSSQCLYGGSQPSLSPGDLMSSCDPVNTRHACGKIHACRQSTHTHKNKTNKLLSTGGGEDGC